MKVRIKIETEFGWGECRLHEIGTIERCSIDPSKDGLGISLAEGKSILKEVQRAVLQDQVEEISEVARVYAVTAMRICLCTIDVSGGSTLCSGA